MRLILSRKGFDSGAGGCPSPVLPDGRLLSLPIPDVSSPLRYRDLTLGDIQLGELVEQLTGGRYPAGHPAHLDPDLQPAMLARAPQWRPLLGQAGSAQGHLLNQNVGVGDIFLFFGLFQLVKREGGRWCFDKHAPRQHVLWGWLQVGAVFRIAELGADELAWARYHPHFAIAADATNTLYVAADALTLGDGTTALPGAGVFTHFEQRLCLTDRSGSSLSTWRLPPWFYPEGRKPLSFHHNRERWRQRPDCTLLTAAARGQEFVLQADEYPETNGWLRQLLRASA